MARKPGHAGKSSTPMATTLILPNDGALIGSNGKGGLEETQRVQMARSRSAAGVYRAKVKDAVEKEHLDAAAWADAIKYKNLDDDTLHVRLFHFLHYIEVLGVVKRAKAQEEMFAAGDLGPAPKGEGTETDDSKVTHIGKAARKVAEAAGAGAAGGG